MSEPKNITNTLYHAAVVSGIAITSAKLMKTVLKLQTPKLAFDLEDMGLTALNIGLGMYARDLLVKNKIIPDDIMH